MAASLSKSLKLQKLLLLPSSRQLGFINNSHLSPFATSDATLSPPSPSPQSSQPTASTSASQSQEKERGIFSKFLLFIPGAITFGLGTWQLFRRQEKIEMLDYRRKRLEMEPINCKELAFTSHDLASLEFRKVLCEGDFDESKSVYVGPRSRSISGVTENGYYVITPLIPRETDEPGCVQTPVLVNRGWVPRNWRDQKNNDRGNIENDSKVTNAITQDEKIAWWKFWSKKPAAPEVKKPLKVPVKVIGVIRGSEKPSIFVPPNDPNSGQWFYIDVPMIARECGLPENTVYIEDIDENVNAADPYPVPKDASTLIRHSVMPQDHLNYTFTWYTLSAAVTFMAVKRIKARKIRL